MEEAINPCAVEKTCLVVTNPRSGSWREHDRDKIRQVLSQYAVHFADIDSPLPPMDTLDALAVAGGDGTLHNFLNRVRGADLPLYYFPTGTLNERARIGENRPMVGRINDDYFVYVVAAGSFTPIGYTTALKKKKRFKYFAYIAEAVRQYKVHRIQAEVVIDGRRYRGTYSLLMVLRSPRCFLFRFNKMYRADADKVHLLLIPAPKSDRLWGKICLFLPLFRAFFVGFRHEKESKHLVFREGHTAVVHLDAPTCFNIDGECVPLTGTYRLTATQSTPAITVCHLPKGK